MTIFIQISLHLITFKAPLLTGAAIVLFLAFFGRNSVARANTYDDQLPSWPLMACTAASPCSVAEVDEDPLLGRLDSRLPPSRRRGSPLHRCCHFGLLSTPPPVRLSGRVASVVRRLLFKLPNGSPFGRHELFGGRLFFGELHRDLGDTVGGGHVRLLEDDDALP
jgi:hypothetical protein